jgi:hypothetical protein
LGCALLAFVWPALIVCLFFIGRPTAIAGLVISIIVDAIDTVTIARTSTHVGEEVLEPV